jgi:PAS domain S-box-containing protein
MTVQILLSFSVILIAGFLVWHIRYRARAASLEPQKKNSPATLISIFILFTVGLTAAGYLTYQNYEKQFFLQVKSELSAVASLKVAGLQNWREERLANASLFYYNENFSERVQNYLENPQDAEAKTRLLNWLDKMSAFPDYDRVFLLDVNGVERISIPATPEAAPPSLIEQASASLASDQIIFLDFHRHPDSDAIHLATLIPIFDPQTNQPLGTLVLRINPNVYLYPFIQQWPEPSQSAETLLVRREGEDIVFLNPLRFEPNAALNLRFPLRETQIPAVKAALGQTGMVEGLDYRGTQVVADTRAVPNSPWFLVSKMDTTEVYAPLHEHLWQTILLLGALVLVAGAGLMLVWRQQRMRFYRGQIEAAEALIVSETRYRRLFEAARDGILILDAETGVILDVNPFLAEMLSIPKEEFVGKELWELGFFKDIAANKENFLELQRKGYIRYEDLPLETADGRKFNVEFVSNVYLVDQHKVIQCNIRDITERKLADEKLRESEEYLRLAHDAAELGSWREDISTRTSHLDERACKHYDVDETDVPSQVIFSRTHPEDLPRLREEIGMTLNKKDTDGRLTTDYRIVHRDGSIHWLSVHSRLHLEERDGKRIPIFGTGTTQDITARKDSEQKLVQRTHQLRLINEATRMLNTSLKAQAVYDVIYTSISQLLPCDTLFVSSFDPASKMISMSGGWHDGQPLDISKYEPIPLEPEGSGTQSLVIRSKESLLVPDFQARLKNTQVVQHFDENGNPEDEPPEDADIPRSALVAPLLVEGEVFGVIQVFSYRLNAYTEDDLQILNGVSAQAAIALSNARLYEDIQQENLERKKAEEALAESEKRFRSIFETSGMGIFESTVDGHLININSAYAHMFGFDSVEDAMQNITTIAESIYVHPEKQTQFINYVLEHPGMASFENEYRRRDGTTFIGELKLQAMQSAENQSAYIFGYVEDISQRKQAETEVRERTEDLELVNKMNEAVNRGDNLDSVIELFARELGRISQYKDATIYLLSPDGKHLIMQHLSMPPALLKKIEQMIGRPLPQVEIPIKEGSYFQNALLSEQGIITTDPKTIQKWMKEFTETNYLPAAIRGPVRKLIPQIYKLLNISSTLVLPLISDKKIIGLLDVSSAGILTEKDLSRIRKISGQVTAVILREQANKALLESEERYRAIFDGVQDAIFVETKDGRILGVNHRACEMYGYTRDEFIGKTVKDLVPEGNSIFPAADMQSNNSRIPLETINRRANGALFPVEVSGGLQTLDGEEVLLAMVRDITERKQAEEALNESKLLFHLLIESLPQNIYAKDTHGRFIFANQNYCTTQGSTLEEILGKTDFELHPPELAQKYLLDDQRVIETGKTIELEEEHQPIGGQKTYVQVIKTPFSYSKGQPPGILGIFWDITERKKTEENIRQRVKALELLYENSVSVNQSLNPKEIAQKVIELLGEKLDWHHTAIRLLNNQDNTLELAAFDLQGIREEEKKENLEHLSKLITRIGEGLSGWAPQQSKTLRIGDVSSNPHYVESYPGIHSGLYAPLKSGERLLGVISIESEKPNAFSEADEQLIITLANQAAVALENARLYEEINRYAEELEQRVRERTAEIETTRRRLELAIQTAGIGIWELDIKQNKDYWDDKLFTLYGLSKEASQPTPDTWHNMIHPDDLVQQLKLMDDTLRNSQPYNTEFRVIWPDTSIHHIKSTGIVVRDTDGNPERMIGANQDITLYKQAEETLRLANAEMENALRTKNEFLSTMSHELRTPLNAIMGISESLEEQVSGPLNEKQLKYVRVINESGYHLLELINDILDLSKIEAGKLEINIQPITVEKLCASSLRMVRELAQKKSLHISFKLDEKVKIILGDERRLKQSLVNLLGNAVKFTLSGKKIGLEVHGNAESNEVTFTVWDEGIGIQTEDMPRLFKPFVQLNSSLTREYGGTGLGLALVAQMVRLHGGRISLESKLKAGSRFTITLPWLPAEQKPQAQISTQVLVNNPKLAAVRVETSNAKRSDKILIVDDTQTVAQFIRDYLQSKGYEAVIAYDGREAVLLAKQEHPQLILMDVMMPVMNGMDATRQIRADAALKNIPIIGLTALAMSSDREQCLAAGMNDYLSKPIQLHDLLQTIERYLNQTG